jgi:hypothetical protein
MYQQTKKLPTFEGHLSKQTNNWNEFHKFKESEDAKALLAKNKKNADNKVHHHHLGPGGYETTMPKWDKQEQDMIARGIQPEPIRDVGNESKNFVPCASWFIRRRNRGPSLQ